MKRLEYLYNAKINQKGISIIALMMVILVLAVVVGVALGHFTDNNSQEVSIESNNEVKNNITELDKEHVHNFVVLVRSEDVKCGEFIKSVVKCECGEEKIITSTETLKHVFHKVEKIKKATCKEDGETQYSCIYCGELKTEKIEKLEHNFTVKLRRKKYMANEATLTEPATYYYKCQTCDEHGEETY